MTSITIFLGVELLPLGEPSSFISLHSSGGVLRVSAQEMFQRLTPRVDLELPDLHKINYCRVSSVITVLDKDLVIKEVRINMMLRINNFEEENWINKIVLASVPSDFLSHVLNLGTRFLFSRGELSHP